jgi:hypothetical protein
MKRAQELFTRVATVTLVVTLATSAVAENIDPMNDGSQYAWAENVGWINAEPSGDGGPGVEVGDFELTGWLWGENIGWINLSCENTSSCGSKRYGVANDTYGNLSGFAWGENVGWVNFRPSTAAVAIDPTNGNFSGRAWGENIGWITFASTGPNPFKVTTAWRCDPNPGPVANTLQLAHNPGSGQTTLTWGAIALATHYNTYRGTSPAHGMGSRATAHDHTCFESDDAGGDGATQSRDFAAPIAGTAFYYLVSGERTCEGPLGNASSGSPRPNFDTCPTPP